MYKSIIALISCSMDENLNKFREKFEADIVEDFEPIVEVSNWYTIWFPNSFLVDIWNSIICFIFHVRNVKKKQLIRKAMVRWPLQMNLNFPIFFNLYSSIGCWICTTKLVWSNKIQRNASTCWLSHFWYLEGDGICWN